MKNEFDNPADLYDEAAMSRYGVSYTKLLEARAEAYFIRAQQEDERQAHLSKADD